MYVEVSQRKPRRSSSWYILRPRFSALQAIPRSSWAASMSTGDEDGVAVWSSFCRRWTSALEVRTWLSRIPRRCIGMSKSPYWMYFSCRRLRNSAIKCSGRVSSSESTFALVIGSHTLLNSEIIRPNVISVHRGCEGTVSVDFSVRFWSSMLAGNCESPPPHSCSVTVKPWSSAMRQSVVASIHHSRRRISHSKGGSLKCFPSRWRPIDCAARIASPRNISPDRPLLL